MSKKLNPRRVPVNAADLKRAKDEAVQEATTLCWAIFFRVLRDKFGFGGKRLMRLWDYVNEYSEAIGQKEISAADLIKSLQDEGYNITYKGK